MRKALSFAACVLALVSTYPSLASGGAGGGAAATAASVNATLQQVVDRLAPRTPEALKTSGGGATGSVRSAAQADAPAQERDQLAMLLAAVTIMGLIIRRRMTRGE